MNTNADKEIPEHKNKLRANEIFKRQRGNESICQLMDARPESITHKRLQTLVNASPQILQLRVFQKIASKNSFVPLQLTAKAHFIAKQGIQKKENNTGLPDDLKMGIESLSGISFNDVKVHHNSEKPAQLSAHAYAQGTNIYLGPGKEHYLPHEAWHVVQQKQGRVKPTIQLHSAVAINDDKALENEADLMGTKALQIKSANIPLKEVSISSNTKQLVGGWLGWGRDLALGGLAVTGTLAGAYYGGTALGALGAKAGAVAGSVLGPLGTIAGSVIGGGLGMAGGALAGYGGYNLLSKGIEVPSEEITKSKLPSTGELMRQRAMQIAKNKGRSSEEDAFLDYLPESIKKTKDELKTNGDVDTALNKLYPEKFSKSREEFNKDPKYLTELTGILFKNPLINNALSGEFIDQVISDTDSSDSLEVDHKQDHKSQENEPLVKRGLKIPDDAPKNVKIAKTMFDSLVARNLSPLSIHKNKIDPISAMGQEGELYIGTVNTPGVLLHEMGHHLEHNLSPEKFATLHKFLAFQNKMTTAKKAPWDLQDPLPEKVLKKVGYENLLKREQKDTGYNINMPESQEHSESLLNLVGHGILNKFGNKKSESAIDEFIIAHGNSQKSSYATMIYPSTNDTEYLSTTIHYFSNPKMLTHLVKTNPLRLALFFYLANKPQYLLIKNAVAKEMHLNLDDLIHIVTLEH
jgi:hypothetical protein